MLEPINTLDINSLYHKLLNREKGFLPYQIGSHEWRVAAEELVKGAATLFLIDYNVSEIINY